MTVITMSCNELTRLRVLIDVADGRLSVEDATGLIDVGRRQIYRLLQAFHADGPDGLISRKRGGPSNRALGAVFRETVLAICMKRKITTSGFAGSTLWRISRLKSAPLPQPRCARTEPLRGLTETSILTLTFGSGRGLSSFPETERLPLLIKSKEETHVEITTISRRARRGRVAER
jgi:hypothetical protein